jgi:hypothetical protein
MADPFDGSNRLVGRRGRLSRLVAGEPETCRVDCPSRSLGRTCRIVVGAYGPTRLGCGRAACDGEVHEDAVWIEGVAGEGWAVGEPVPVVEPPRRSEKLLAPGLEVEVLVVAPPRFVHDPGKQERGDTPSPRGGGGAHGLDFTLLGGQLLQRATAKQRAVLPGSPKRYPPIGQC